MQPISLTIDLEGRFFTADVRRTVRQNLRALSEALAEQGEAEVKARLAGGGREAAHTARLVRGRTHAVASRGGRQWALTAVISPYTDDLDGPQAVRALAIAAGRKNPIPHGRTRGAEGRTHAFARTKRALRIAGKAAAVDLVKGLE